KIDVRSPQTSHFLYLDTQINFINLRAIQNAWHIELNDCVTLRFRQKSQDSNTSLADSKGYLPADITCERPYWKRTFHAIEADSVKVAA
ncbi:hypothetical protein, partial [Escherichia coli]|uniref:hypothetical protein n=1 Tax=Escherichia coli TaxID=562 RepID=UPI003CEF3E9B